MYFKKETKTPIFGDSRFFFFSRFFNLPLHTLHLLSVVLVNLDKKSINYILKFASHIDYRWSCGVLYNNKSISYTKTILLMLVFLLLTILICIPISFHNPLEIPAVAFKRLTVISGRSSLNNHVLVISRELNYLSIMLTHSDL